MNAGDGKITPARLCSLLTGQERLWWECCHEAVLYDKDWLTSRDSQEILSFIEANSPPRADAVDQAKTVYATAWALAALPGEGAADSLVRVAGSWAGAPAPAAVYEGPRSQPGSPVLPTGLWPGQLNAAAGSPPEAAGSLMALVAVLLLAERSSGHPARARIAVVLAGLQGRAQLAYLELREARIGVAGIFPDPVSSALVTTDDSFKTAVARAWATLPHRERGRCVLWSLSYIDRPAAKARRADVIEGGSLGAAFALALGDLTRFPRLVRRPLRAARAFLHGLRPKTAVTGALDPVGTGLAAVEKLEAKAAEVRGQEGWRLVAPAANEPAGNVPADVVVRARNLKQADQLARRWSRRHLVYTGAVGVAVALAVAVPVGIVKADSDAQAARAQEVAAANQLTTEAGQVSAANSSLAAQLLLAAYHLDPQSQDLSWRLISTESQTLSASENVGGTFDTLGGAVAFSPASITLATVGDNRDAVILWSMGSAAGPRRLGQPLTISNSQEVDALAFSPDGKTLAAAAVGTNATGTVVLWNISNPARPRRVGQSLTIGSVGVEFTPAGGVDDVYSLAFRPDGKTLAAITGTDGGVGTATLWDISDQSRPRQLSSQPLTAGRSNTVNTVALSPDGETLAVSASASAGTVILWSLSDPAHPRQVGQLFAMHSGEGDDVSSLAFSPDGETLAVATDSGDGDYPGIGTGSSWDVSDPAHPRQVGQPFTIGTGSADYVMAFSPDGTTLAVGAVPSNGVAMVTLWDVSDLSRPRQIRQLPTAVKGGIVGSVAFSPDGTSLAAGSSGGIVTLWSLPSAALPLSTAGTADAAVFSPDGRTLADVSGSDAVTLWSLGSPARPRQVSQPLTAGNGSIAKTVAFSPDGATLAVGVNTSSSLNGISSSGSVALWNVSNPAKPRRLNQFSLPPTADNGTTAPAVNAVAFSRDGKTLAVGADDGTVTLWTVSDPAHPRQLFSRPILDRNYSVQSVAFSPDGTTLAVGATGGFASTDSVTLCNLGDLAHPSQCGQPFTVGATAAFSGPVSLSFSPAGETLAVGTASTSNTVSLWDVSNLGRPRQLSEPLTVGSGNAEEPVAFSRDGTTLAAADGDAVVLWDMSDPTAPSQLGQPLETGNGTPVSSVAFSPGAATLVAGDSDGVQVWNRDVGFATSRICGLTGGELTKQEWSQYIPQMPYDPPCPSH
jgi:WD40 repeat protein